VQWLKLKGLSSSHSTTKKVKDNEKITLWELRLIFVDFLSIFHGFQYEEFHFGS
jgi:hypothetical protein